MAGPGLVLLGPFHGRLKGNSKLPYRFVPETSGIGLIRRQEHGEQRRW